MKQQPKPPNLQLRLPLLDLTPADLPPDKQRELALVIAELLVSAVSQSAGPQTGNDDEPKADL